MKQTGKPAWLAAVLAAAALTACGGAPGADAGQEVDGVSTEQMQEETSGSSAGLLEEGADAEDGSIAGREQADDSGGYAFDYEGLSIRVDEPMADVLAALGEPDKYYEAASCAFDGLDKMYTYGSFEIDTYPDGGTDYISAVILKDDLVSTAEGASIGDAQEDVTAIYGEGREESGMTVYEKDGMKLCFLFQDGAAVSVEYRSTALD
ncbi:MAG: hypothetical protein Q4C82_05475 [Eubacteriales bacterium]|nr:hypothetical protein [Eubacteriales bacterium]